MSDGKVCKGCGEFKPLDAFNRNKRMKDGLSSKCRECDAEYRRAWYRANWDRCKEYRQKYYIENWDAISVKRKKYYREHRDAMLEYQRRYRQESGYANYKRVYDRMRYQHRKNARASA